MQRDGTISASPARARVPRLAAPTPALAEAWRALWLSRLVVWAAGSPRSRSGASRRARRALRPGGLTRPFGALGDALVAPAARWDAVWFLRDRRRRLRRRRRAPRSSRSTRCSSRRGGRAPRLAAASPAIARLARRASLVALVAAAPARALELGRRRRARCRLVARAASRARSSSRRVYSESLFLALSVGAVYAARTERWAWAGALGGARRRRRAAPGVVLLVPLGDPVVAQRDAARRADARVAGARAAPGSRAFCARARARAATTRWRRSTRRTLWFRALRRARSSARGTARSPAWDGARQLLHGSRTPVYFDAAGGDPFDLARTTSSCSPRSSPCVAGAGRRAAAAAARLRRLRARGARAAAVVPGRRRSR